MVKLIDDYWDFDYVVVEMVVQAGDDEQVKVVNVVDWKFYQHNQLDQVVEVYKVSKVDVVHVMNEVENSHVDVLMMIGDENDFEN